MKEDFRAANFSNAGKANIAASIGFKKNT